MNAIDLNRIIEERELDPKQLAAHLYPNNLHPLPALTRVLKEQAQLDENQISKLAALLGVNVSELFKVRTWSHSFGSNEHTFKNDKFEAVLDTDTWITRIFHAGALVHSTLISNGSITLKEYFITLNTEILKTENEKLQQG